MTPKNYVIRIISFFGLISNVVLAQNKPVNTLEGMFTPLSSLIRLEQGLRSDKVAWKENILPQAALYALAKSHGGESFIHIDAQHDLNGDGQPEYLVCSLSSGSGGSEYTILANQNGKWKTIGRIQGGFNIAPHDREKPGSYSHIETWSRHGGQIYHSFWEYKKGRYRQTGTIEWPIELSPPRPPFDDRGGSCSRKW